MQIDVLTTADAVAQSAAKFIASSPAAAAIDARGRFKLAGSGGHTRTATHDVLTP
jgi:6-phosphogluconolactonase/glucosamine-6-phosphate isomerase/deaminase